MSIQQRRAQDAGIAWIAFLACIAMIGMAYMFTFLREVGPAIREVIHWLVTPQFAMGMCLMAALALFCALLWAVFERKNL